MYSRALVEMGISSAMEERYRRAAYDRFLIRLRQDGAHNGSGLPVVRRVDFRTHMKLLRKASAGAAGSGPESLASGGSAQGAGGAAESAEKRSPGGAGSPPYSPPTLAAAAAAAGTAVHNVDFKSIVSAEMGTYACRPS